MQLIQGMNRAVTINAGGTATIFRGRRRNWREAAERVARLAGGLARLGVRPGDSVAILALKTATATGRRCTPPPGWARSWCR